MKKQVCLFLSTALLATAILLGAATASAHSMPFEEATLVLDDPSGRQIELIPFKSTLRKTRTAILGAGITSLHEEYDSTYGSTRTVCYVYRSLYSFFCDTDAGDLRAADKLPIRSFNIRGAAIRTRSGFCVGTPYAAVVAAYGEASKMERNEPTLLTYYYEFEGRGARLLFDVDDNGIIYAIMFRSDE